MLYLRFNDERKRLMREMEESKLIIGSGNDSSRKKYVEKNSLEEIPENDEDDAGNASEEHDIYDNQSSKGSKSSKRNEENSNDDDDKKKSDNSKDDSQSENSKKSDSSGGKNKKEVPIKQKKDDSEKPSLFNFVNPYDVDNYQKKNSLLDNNSHKDSGKNLQNQNQNSKLLSNEQSKLNNPYVQANFGNSQNTNNEIKNHFLNKGQEKSKSGQTISANNSSGEDSSFNNSSMKEANKHPNSNAKKLKKQNDSNYKEKEINLQNLKTQKSALSNLSRFEKKKSGDYESDKMSNVFKNITANPEIEPLSANDVNYMNVELSEHFEKKKNLINQTFLDKVEKIIAFLEENSIEFSNDPENNPLEMLKRLKNVEDVNERNQLIDKIEHIVAELFKNDKKDAN